MVLGKFLIAYSIYYIYVTTIRHTPITMNKLIIQTMFGEAPFRKRKANFDLVNDKIPILVIDSDNYHDAVLTRETCTKPFVDVRVMFSHGNGQDLYSVETLLKLISHDISLFLCNDKRYDVRVLIFAWDYPGYGDASSTTGISESMVCEWAESVRDYALNYVPYAGADIKPAAKKVLMYWGYSAGTGPSCYLSIKEPYPQILFLQSPFSSANEALHNPPLHYKCLLSLASTVSGKVFDNEECVRSCSMHSRTHVKIAYAKDDIVVTTPPSLLSLADSTKVYETGGHSIFSREDAVSVKDVASQLYELIQMQTCITDAEIEVIRRKGIETEAKKKLNRARKKKSVSQRN